MFRYLNFVFPVSKPVPNSDLAMEVYSPSRRHTHTIIFLHGRDDTAAEFSDALFECQTSDGKHLQDHFPHAKWVFPTAPILMARRLELEISQWFDMWTTEDPHDGEDGQDPTSAIDAVHKIIQQEVGIVGAQNIILAGISQGCAVAIHSLLKQERKLGGFIGLSSWLPKPSAIANAGKRFPCALDTPVFLGHCQRDPIINVKYGEELRDCLKAIDMRVEWHSYNDDKHWISEPDIPSMESYPTEVDDIVDFLHKTMKTEISRVYEKTSIRRPEVRKAQISDAESELPWLHGPTRVRFDEDGESSEQYLMF
ncbi:hypothetical protein AC578_6166 [Pseudocercospora eumusae]|uniref:Phospholipase/carboxylesterase/thioesterase domain-containing protein n=1 Tax=Pseudocercospora eumusae TaxID=321146 RepID=A0A139H965_9PEZI|nr:hypothetical protein AC578_6166 [Pseudocercospora eumusae]